MMRRGASSRMRQCNGATRSALYRAGYSDTAGITVHTDKDDGGAVITAAVFIACIHGRNHRGKSWHTAARVYARPCIRSSY